LDPDAVPAERNAPSIESVASGVKELLGAGKRLIQNSKPPVLLFFGVLGGMLFLAALMPQLRKRKGTLKISFNHRVYLPSEKIEGYVLLRARRAFDCRQMMISLRCSVDASGRHNRGSRQVVYEDSHPLMGSVKLVQGEHRRLAFNITVPDAVARITSVKLADKAGSGMVGSLISSAMQIVAFIEKTTRQWELVVEVDAEGLDLFEKQRVIIKKVA